MEKGSVVQTTLYSEALGENMNLLIYTPSTFTPMMTYPVAIASDGNDYFQLGSIPRLMDELLDEGDIEEYVVVGVPYKSVEDRRQKYLLTGAQHESYLTFLKDELLPFLMENYAVSAEYEEHVLFGDSQAATVSLLGVIKYPDVFGRAILHSPQISEDVLNLAQNMKNAHHLAIYHAVGLGENKVLTKDGSIKDFLTPNRELQRILSTLPIQYDYIELDGDHTWKTWKPNLPIAMKRIFNF